MNLDTLYEKLEGRNARHYDEMTSRTDWTTPDGDAIIDGDVQRVITIGEAEIEMSFSFRCINGRVETLLLNRDEIFTTGIEGDPQDVLSILPSELLGKPDLDL